MHRNVKFPTIVRVQAPRNGISFEINSNSNEIRRAEHEYMNKHPPISVLVTGKMYSRDARRAECFHKISKHRVVPTRLLANQRLEFTNAVKYCIIL